MADSTLGMALVAHGVADPSCDEQDTDTANSPHGPSFLLKLSNDDELIFTFTFVMRQAGQQLPLSQDQPSLQTAPSDTSIYGLTFVYASTPREVETLVTREFHADPNLHKNANVELVGDYSTGGAPSVSFEWTWKWKPPKNAEDRGGGWRNFCSVCSSDPKTSLSLQLITQTLQFMEYDSRTHGFRSLASFSYWVSGSCYAHQVSCPRQGFRR